MIKKLDERKFDIISFNNPSFVGLKYEEDPTRKSILIGEKIILQRFEHRTSWTTCSYTMLNHRLTQKLKLIGESKLILYHLTKFKDYP